MHLEAIRLLNFRNIESAELACGHPRIFLEGPNGQGKTNLLEAVSLFGSLRSFRTSQRHALIRNGENEAAIYAMWNHEQQGQTSALIRMTQKKRSVAIDDQPVARISDFIGRFNSVTMASHDIQIIRGGPSERRRFLDNLLVSTDAVYMQAHQKCQLALAERNKLLKLGKDGAQMKAFDAVWVPSAWTLMQKRAEAISALSQVVADVYKVIAQGKEEPGLVYAPNANIETRSFWEMCVSESLQRDQIVGSTQRGPHRDDLKILINDNPADQQASEGQQRALVLALRFAEMQWILAQTGRQPILLADDILTELDPTRRNQFWKLLGAMPQLQIIATGTQFPESEDREKWQAFEVKEGNYTAMVIQ